MSPLRWDVLAVSFLLALPVLALGLQGTFTVEEMTGKLPWCFAAGWGVVALLRWASQPRSSSPVAVAHKVHADDEAPTPV
jgi:hypothetical protein